MDVIKKDGSRQAFSRDKIETSVRNTSLDIREGVSDRDVNLITDDVVRELKKLRGTEGTTSIHEIRMLTALAIRSFGYEKIANHYIKDIFE